MSDVFVSYKRENLAAVGSAGEALRAEAIGVWWDLDIPPSAAWEATSGAADVHFAAAANGLPLACS